MASDRTKGQKFNLSADAFGHSEEEILAYRNVLMQATQDALTMEHKKAMEKSRLQINWMQKQSETQLNQALLDLDIEYNKRIQMLENETQNLKVDIQTEVRVAKGNLNRKHDDLVRVFQARALQDELLHKESQVRNDLTNRLGGQGRPQ